MSVQTAGPNKKGKLSDEATVEYQEALYGVVGEEYVGVLGQVSSQVRAIPHCRTAADACHADKTV